MKAVFDCTVAPSIVSQREGVDMLTPFLPVMGKLFIHHTLSHLAHLGVTELAVFVSDHANRFEQYIDDGQRWGFSVIYHLCKKGTRVAQRVAKSEWIEADESFLFCNSVSLPLIDSSHLTKSVRILSETGDDPLWTYCTGEEFKTLPESIATVTVKTLCVRTSQRYLESLSHVLTHGGGPLVVMGKQIREGVWVGPGTKIHVSCTITAPAFIGARVNLGDRVIIGPHSEIGDGCIVDDGSSVIESSILPGSYIGRNLEVRSCIVNQNTIFNVELQSAYVAADEMLASSVEDEESSLHKLCIPIPSRLLALVLALITLPILVVIWIVNRLVFHRSVEHLEVVSMRQAADTIQTGDEESLSLAIFRKRSELQHGIWSHFIWVFLPGLWQVVRGRSRFFGIPYRTKADFEKLSKEWQKLYLASNPGLITEADILYDTFPGEEMLFASEMYYQVVDSLSYNGKLLGRYIRRLFSRTQ